MGVSYVDVRIRNIRNNGHGTKPSVNSDSDSSVSVIELSQKELFLITVNKLTDGFGIYFRAKSSSVVIFHLCCFNFSACTFPLKFTDL